MILFFSEISIFLHITKYLILFEKKHLINVFNIVLLTERSIKKIYLYMIYSRYKNIKATESQINEILIKMKKK